MKPILTLLAFAASLAGQSPALCVDPSGEWRFQTGDRPEYASPEFDDSAWPTIRLPRSGKQPQGYWWLRRTIDLPEWADTTHLAITMAASTRCMNSASTEFWPAQLAGRVYLKPTRHGHAPSASPRQLLRKAHGK